MRGSRPPGINTQRVCAWLAHNRGNVASIAAACGCTENAVYLILRMLRAEDSVLLENYTPGKVVEAQSTADSIVKAAINSRSELETVLRGWL